MLILGDSLEKLKELDDNSVDSCVCDPPYGLSFMAKKWDYDVPSTELWREVFRVLKPGGHVLAFGGTRTYHRLVVNIEDAGFEIRDQIQWLYGSGFPKSYNVSKGIDKHLGAEPTVIGKIKAPASTKRVGTMGRPDHSGSGWNETPDLTAPATDEAKQWDGWGTALKPANEPICLARKPLSEKTVAKNVLRWGVGGLNIDGCRVSMSESCKAEIRAKANKGEGAANSFQGIKSLQVKSTKDKFSDLPLDKGRWPANVILDEDAAESLDAQVDDNVSRFFYVAKASKRERGEGNGHPTVKPIKLMSYLVKLVTPPGGTVLDPFMGSGTTGIAANNEGFEFIGIELEQEYYEISRQRIAASKSA